MDHRLVTIAAIVLVVLALAGLAWFTIARMSAAAPARVGVVIIALAAFVTAIATMVNALEQ